MVPTTPARREQLRLAKRAQRDRERHSGLAHVQLRLPRKLAEKLTAAARQEGFADLLDRAIDEALVNIADYPALHEIAWNRREPWIAARDALRLYERNWRFVDAGKLEPRERALIERLSARFGGGPLDA
jgi:hypothetical protein